MRLIDGNKIVMSLADWWYSSFRQEETEESKAIKKVMEQVEKMVMEMPEIVRCGHCEWWKCNPNTEEYGVCKKVSYDDFEVVMDSDDFCSYGVKRG